MASLRPRGRPSPEQTISADRIKLVARRQMQALGTAGLTLRSIARELNVTAPAIYNYFPRLDDLVTALIVDAFNGLADAMIDAGEQLEADRVLPRIQAMTVAFRTWATTHATEFQLIYGNPIPGYEAPADVTVPLAAKPFVQLGRYLGEALATGEIGIPGAYPELPEPMRAHILDQFGDLLNGAPPEILCLLASTWARFHGIVMLELFGHLSPVVGDVGSYYGYELRTWLRMLENASTLAQP